MARVSLKRLARILEKVTQALAASGAEYGWSPASDAPAQAEWASDAWLKGRWGTQPVQDAYRTSLIALPSVIEHATALQHSLHPEFRVFPVHTLARALAETSSRVAYLLEPGVDPEERARRHLNDELFARREDVLLSSEFEDDYAISTREHHAGAIEDIVCEARERNWPTVRDRRKEVWLHPLRPNNMVLIRTVVERTGAAAEPNYFYRVTSGVGHGQLIALARNFELTTSSTSPSGQVFRLGPPNVGDLADNLTPALLCLVACGDAVYTSSAWDATHWTKVRDLGIAAWAEVACATT